MHALVRLEGTELAIRDLQPDDVDAIVTYWSRADDDLLARIGVSRTKLGAAADIAARFLAAVPNGDPNQAKLAFAIVANGALIGYTNLNHHGARDNVSHWHLIERDRRGRGISTALYPYRLRTYFDCIAMDRLTHQTRTGNKAMNRVLDHYVPVAETIFLARPDGLAEPGEFNIRHVERSDLPRILALAPLPSLV